ncbi:MAG: radical SAM protein [Elusimicrobia bacterium]|nr:radical SAM protein [Elusimicrobiota bacterium]
MNILLTQKCVRACPYCFAKKHMSASAPEDVLPWEDMVYLADFAEEAGQRHISLLGGEPTLHPDFADMLLYLRERGFSVTVFTSGIMSDQKLSSLLASSPEWRDGVRFICNLNDPTESTDGETRRVERFLAELGPNTKPGFNIHHADFDLTFLCRLVDRYKLIPRLRLGLAHPAAGVEASIPGMAQMRHVAGRLIEQLPALDNSGIEVALDCGFPLCIFTDSQLGRLLKSSDGTLKFNCGPAIDVGPDMRVWACFPLSAMEKRSIYEFDNMNALVGHFDKMHEKIRASAGGVFERCLKCPHLGQLCDGGCLARAWGRGKAPETLPAGATL